MAIIDIEMTDEKLIESLMNILQFYKDDMDDYDDDEFFQRYLNNATEIAVAINEKRIII